MTAIPLVDLRAQYAAIAPAIDAAIRAVVDGGAFVMGPAVRDFEAAFAAFCEAPHAVGCGNGTDALHLALRALDVGAGHEVITTPHTFVATAEAITMTGATPVFADVDARGLLDPARVEAALTPRTRAIVPVHLYGQLADVDAIAAIAARHGLAVVEDAAQAHGARLRGRRAGALATAGTFSFYPGKNLGAYGDAGAIVTADAALARRCARLRDHGRRDKYVHDEPGFNSRLDTLQAAVLLVKLAHLDAWNAARRRVAGWYLERLAGVPDLALPAPDGDGDGDAEPVWHLFVVHHPARDAIRARLAEAGIATGIHYPVPLHLQPAYRALGHAAGDFPVAERLAATCLSLPMYPELAEADVERVAAAVRRAS